MLLMNAISFLLMPYFSYSISSVQVLSHDAVEPTIGRTQCVCVILAQGYKDLSNRVEYKTARSSLTLILETDRATRYVCVQTDSGGATIVGPNTIAGIAPRSPYASGRRTFSRHQSVFLPTLDRSMNPTVASSIS